MIWSVRRAPGADACGILPIVEQVDDAQGPLIGIGHDHDLAEPA
jgi:hypothetical protein